MFALIIFIKS